MNKDKSVPFTLEEEKKLAKTRYFLKLSPLFIILGFFLTFAGFVLCLIGGLEIEENIILLYVGAPLLISGIIFFLIFALTRKLNKKVYEKMIYRSIVDNFVVDNFKNVELRKIKNTILQDEEIMNVLIDSVLDESYEFKKGNSEIQLINILKSTPLNSQNRLISEMFKVDGKAYVGNNNIGFATDFKGLLVIIKNINLNLSYPIEIRSNSPLSGNSLYFSDENLIKNQDFFAKTYRIYAKSTSFYILIGEKLKKDLVFLKNAEKNIILILKNNVAYFLIRDTFVTPKKDLVRDAENIYQVYSKNASMYFLINRVIEDLVKE